MRSETSPMGMHQDFSGEDYLGDALLAMMERFRNAKTIVTTLGDRGALALKMTTTSHEVRIQTLLLSETCDSVHRCMIK